MNNGKEIALKFSFGSVSRNYLCKTAFQYYLAAGSSQTLLDWSLPFGHKAASFSPQSMHMDEAHNCFTVAARKWGAFLSEEYLVLCILFSRLEAVGKQCAGYNNTEFILGQEREEQRFSKTRPPQSHSHYSIWRFATVDKNELLPPYLFGAVGWDVRQWPTVSKTINSWATAWAVISDLWPALLYRPIKLQQKTYSSWLSPWFGINR